MIVALSTKKRLLVDDALGLEDVADLAGVGAGRDLHADGAVRGAVERLERRVDRVQREADRGQREHGEDAAAPVPVVLTRRATAAPGGGRPARAAAAAGAAVEPRREGVPARPARPYRPYARPARRGRARGPLPTGPSAGVPFLSFQQQVERHDRPRPGRP